MKNLKYTPIVLLALIVPSIAFGASLADLFGAVTDLIAGSIIKLIFGVAIVYFMWGVVQYVLNPSQEAKEKGREKIIIGLIALTIMFSVYALVKAFQTTFKLTDNGALPTTKLPQ